MMFQKTEARRHSSWRMHIPTSTTGVTLAAAERARRVLGDPNSFIGWARDWVSCIPRTVVVRKGGKLPNLRLKYPVVVKSAEGDGVLIKCLTLSSVQSAVKKMKGAYQVQEYLMGFTFLRLYCRGGQVEVYKKQVVDGRPTEALLAPENRYSQTALHASRRLIETIMSLGVKSFTLTMAVEKETVYVISCCPDSGQMSQ